jgi:hypothetical protein
VPRTQTLGDGARARTCLTFVTPCLCSVVYTDDRPTREEQIAWAAGLFDGERSITLSDDVLHVRTRNTDLELIERFRDTIGVGAVYGPYTRGERDGFAGSPSGTGSPARKTASTRSR